jgi:NAD(P)-dependent dehydrogenase (short-subunit alcohol dehydrogenase family)
VSLPARSPKETLCEELAFLRQAVSGVAGFPVILRTLSDPLYLSFSRRNDLGNIARQGPALVSHVAAMKRLPMLGRDVNAYAVEYEQSSRERAAEHSDVLVDPAPRVILDTELGLCTIGRSAKEATLVGELYHHTIQVILRATALEEYRSLPTKELLEADISSALYPIERKPENVPMFAGEIALVTGGASGIGKACVESLLLRGAAVVSLDINPAVETIFDRPDYLGLQCDLTDEVAVRDAFEKTARLFGGLDMLVLNAGIFPPSRRIDAMELAHWQEVMRINLDSNLSVMREAYPLLKLAPQSGRVLLNASKNVLAPGAGVAAYSASKAATTQLARVAALEWGKDGIRVNMIHPDAVFDTGIWTDEKIKGRATHYGMTVEEYKTRNLLRTELNSHYVGELVAEMLGPLFEKITGAQIPVDGGSDRVI